MARLTDPASLERPVPRAVGGIVRVPDAPVADATARGGQILGGAIEKGADVLERQRLIEQEKADTTRVEDAWNQYKNTALDVTLGDKGVLKLQGGAAVNGDMMGTAMRGLNDAKKVISGQLGTDELRTRFNQRAEQTDLITKHQILAHLDTQNREYAKTTMTGSEAAALAQVSASPTSPEVFAQAKVTLLEQADAFLRTQGVTDQKAIDAYKAGLNDKMWAKRIDSILYDNPLLADALLRANSKEFTNPDLRLTLQHKTREAALGMNANIEAQKVFDELKGGEPPTGTRIGAAAASTSGLPSSRDVAALMPKMLERVEPAATSLYGPDKNNPDRAAFVEKMRTNITAKVSAEVGQLNALQRQSQGVLIDAIIGGPSGNKQRITSFAQLQADPKLMQAWQMTDPLVKPHLEELIKKNLEANEKGDYALYRKTWDRINLEPDDPNKINFYAQITDPKISRSLSVPQINSLREELDRSGTPGGRSDLQMRKAGDAYAATQFKTNWAFTAQPDLANEAYMRWREKVGDKIDEYYKAGTNTRSLFMMKTPDSVISPEYLQTFIGLTPAQGLAQKGAAARAGQTPAVEPGPQMAPPTDLPKEITTKPQRDEWFKTLPPEVVKFRAPDGNAYWVPGRKPKATGDMPIDTNRPIIKNPDGTISTERTITVEADGKHFLIPTIVGGKQLSETDAISAWASGTNQAVGTYSSAEEANRAARARSARIGEVRMTDTGKLETPVEPAMPKLVKKMSPKALESAGPSWAEIGSATVRVAGRAGTAVGDTAVEGAQAAGRAGERVVGAVASAATAVTPASDPEKAADAFRGLVRAGQFTPAAAVVINQAITSGLLSGPELKVARAMLAQIEAGK